MRSKRIFAAGLILSSITVATMAFAQTVPDGVKIDTVGHEKVFVDAKGMTLYTFDNDTTANKSSCNDRCAMGWPPLSAGADAKAMGPWTIVTRDDGTKQWAYQGKPLYTFSRDTAAGVANGDNVGPNGTHIWHMAKAG